MQFYLVGGAVRDKMLGFDSNDRDYVVVGATPADLEAKGYKNVGESFPVYMDPVNGDQYALARKERKTGTGYTGFSVEFDPSVTLADDLYRRDLTINAMARDLETGEIVDPYGGVNDLQNKVLRHVSDAFKEDPLRVVRLARFYARFHWLDFTVHPDTVVMARALVDSGEMDALSDERFMAEIEKAFEQARDPIHFFRMLHHFGALSKVKFFKQLFGTIDASTLPQFIIAIETLKSRAVAKELMVPFFVAIVSSIDRDHSSPAVPARMKRMTDNLWAVRSMPSTVGPTEVLGFLNGLRAWDLQSTAVYDLLNVMSLVQNTGEPLPISAFRLMAAVDAGRRVTAQKYMHLKGAEIGRAMAKERLDWIAEVMRG